MIASIKGTVETRAPDHVVVDCGGVGYRLSVSAQTLSKVPPAGRDVHLLAHLIPRDDGMHLFGFASDDERDLFLALVSVAGVGPKMALAVLSGSTAADVRTAIAAGDAKRFQVVPGVGRKTAERIIVELREKISDGLAADLQGAEQATDVRVLAREGLIGLGYDAAEADALLDSVRDEAVEEEGPEVLIAAALRSAAGAGAR
jgi:Holliday junction DNA helicase RuvA